MATYDVLGGPYFRLMAYVCGAACVKPSPFGDDAWSNFTQIFAKRPDGCRYGIAERAYKPEPNFATPRYVVWDFYDAGLVRGSLRPPVKAPRPLEVSTNYDALLMKVLMLYEQ